MFEVGSYVSYRAEGVCVISDIRVENFGLTGCEEYYILTPLKDKNSVLYVPKNNELLVGQMRPLLCADEICALASELREERLEWKSESRARNYLFKDILNSGDRRSLIVLVNTLSEKAEMFISEEKKLTAGEETTLKRAKRMLLDEFSITADIDGEDALMLILQGKQCCVAKN